MLRGIGPRFYIEPAFLILVAAVLAVQRVGPVEIVFVMLVAYLAIVSIELVVARRRVAAAKQPRVVPDAMSVPEPEEVVPSAIVAVRSAEPDQPVAALVAVSDPELELELEPEPVSEPVVIASFPQQPRAWNLWELERLVRTRAGVDPLRDEEWGYLLVYLRDFASPEGVLSEDFDALVRESFGDLLEAAAR